MHLGIGPYKQRSAAGTLGGNALVLLVWQKLEPHKRALLGWQTEHGLHCGKAGMTEEEGIKRPGLVLCSGLLPGSPGRE